MAGGLESLSTDARANAAILLAGNAAGLKFWDASFGQELSTALSQAGLVIDAMLGTGAKGDPRPPLDGWIRLANASPAYRLAIDIPTGVDAESGRLGQPTFSADATLTFVARKPAMVAPRAADVFGELAVLPIGLPEPLLRKILGESS